MFTGIIEQFGTMEALEISSSGARVTIHAPSVAPRLAIANSIAVNGCCLTVVELAKERISADLSTETLAKTSFGAKAGGLQKGERVNLEQPLTAGKEFGGHFVLGHVDTVGRVAGLVRESRESDSWVYSVEVPAEFARHVVGKGSITVDGISLTVARWNPHTRIVEIAVIPYTYQHTNIGHRKPGDAVNLEGDVLGKYVERYLAARNGVPRSSITMERMLEEGF